MEQTKELHMDTARQDAAKEAVGIHAAGLVKDGMDVGLGTGSTTAFAIRELGRRVREENLSIRGVPTSFAAERLAREVGIQLVSLDEVEQLDVALDGADEVDPELNLIKGRGGAHTREKIVASLALQFIALVDASKMVDALGSKKPVPVEVLPMAVSPVMRTLAAMGSVHQEIRMGMKKDGPVVTDQGFWIIDARFDGIADPEKLDSEIQSIPGVLDHGLFIQIASQVLIAEPDGTIRTLAR